MKKVLFVATVVKTHIMEFHIPYLKMFQTAGWRTEVAAKNDFDKREDCIIPFCDCFYDINFARSPLSFKNIKAYFQLKKVIESEHYDIIHCHTPVGALLTRLAARKARRSGSKVIYTAHGFHFFEGAPLINWILYFPIEWICSFLTDTLITINVEDFEFARKHMHAKRIEYVPGVGIDLSKFQIRNEIKQAKRSELEIPDEAVWILNVGELIPRKNQARLIQAVARIPNAYLTIAGRGKLQDELIKTIKDLGVENRVKLLGYRSDVSELCQASDIFAFSSVQEGLPVALMEAMACGKPVVCSRVRGNTDLVDCSGGKLFNPFDFSEIEKAITEIIICDWEKMGRYNAEKIKKFDINYVMHTMKKIYGIY